MIQHHERSVVFADSFFGEISFTQIQNQRRLPPIHLGFKTPFIERFP